MHTNIQLVDLLLMTALIFSALMLGIDYTLLSNHVGSLQSRIEGLRSKTENQSVIQFLELPKEPLNLPMNKMLNTTGEGINALIIYDCYDCAYHNRLLSLNKYFEKYNITIINLKYDESGMVLRAVSDSIGCNIRFQNPIVVIWKGNTTFFFERWEPNEWILTCLEYLASNP